jgi:signal transduction histidine kinase
MSASLLLNHRGQPIDFIFIIQDISERKAAEENQKRLTEDLRRQNEELYQFNYITSHNLRGPIASILGLIDILGIDLNNPEHKEILEHLRTSAHNLDSVITDLNQINSTKKVMDENRQIIVFEKLVKTISDSFSLQIMQSKVEIKTMFADAPSIYSVLSYAHSIISNLIENAIKYRSENRKLIIELKTTMVNNFICLEIRDNGIGIDLDRHRDKVFGLYKRFHTHVEGKGIGLYLVKTQIEALGGLIEVESEPEKGTCFKVYFKNN